MLHKRRGRIMRLAARRGHLHHYFVPGAHNDHRPHFLRPTGALTVAAAVVLFFFIALGSVNLVVRSPSPQIGAVVAAILVELANADRGAEDLPELVISPTLTKAAQMKADDMAALGYFSHDTPDGKTPWYWFEKAGYGFRHAGENLAVYFSDSAEVEKAWMNSPLHRANILSGNYTEIGIALAHGEYQGYDTTFVVQMFASPSESGATVVESSAPEQETSDVVAGASAEARPIGALTGSPNTLWRTLSAPKTTLHYIYTGIAALVLLAIGLLFLGGLRRFHVPSFLSGVALLVLIGFLLYSTTLISGELLIL